MSVGEKQADINREAADSWRESIAAGERIETSAPEDKEEETPWIEEVKLERDREIAAGWTPKRGSGKKTAVQDKVKFFITG